MSSGKTYTRSYSHQSIGVTIELFFQRDDNGLQVKGIVADVRGHFSDIRVIQGSVDLIQDEKGGGLIAKFRKESKKCKYLKGEFRSKVIRNGLKGVVSRILFLSLTCE